MLKYIMNYFSWSPRLHALPWLRSVWTAALASTLAFSLVAFLFVRRQRWRQRLRIPLLRQFRRGVFIGRISRRRPWRPWRWPMRRRRRFRSVHNFRSSLVGRGRPDHRHQLHRLRWIRPFQGKVGLNRIQRLKKDPFPSN